MGQHTLRHVEQIEEIKRVLPDGPTTRGAVTS